MPTDSTRVRPYLLAAALIALIVAFAPAAPPAAAHSPVATDAVEVVSGTVAAIAIEDQVKKTTFDYRELNLDDGTAIPLYGKTAENLQGGTRVRITGRRVGAPLEAASVEVLAMPSLSGRTGEAAIQVEGTLAIAHGDDFAASKSQYFYHVHGDDAKVTTLEVASLPAALRGGSRVVVSGKRGVDASSLRPEQITIKAAPADSADVQSGTIALSPITSTVLVILANFNNTVAPSFTQAEAQQVMTTNSGSVANFYNEASYGQRPLNVTVTSSWVTMNLAGTCSYTSIAPAANAAALALSSTYNASNYNFVVYLFPGQSCGWAGLAYVGSPHQAFINGTGSFNTSIVAHEMGHNFGLLHAGSLNCAGASIGGSCSVSEYGDPWDTMGNQRAMHFNAMQKSLLNWIPASSVHTHTSGSASYTLSPIETGGAATYAVKIPTGATNRTYWIEYRQPLGFDAPLASYPNNGAQIRVSSPFEWSYGADDTEILDMAPASSGNFGDSALLVGQSYLDSTAGVNIIVTGASASALTVSVTTSGGAPSTTTLASSSNPSTVGTSVTFTATVTGTNPTGPVNFKDGASSISGCAAVALAGSGNSRTAACTTNALAGGAHSLVATYSGDAANAGSSSAALSQTVNKVASTTGIGSSLTPSTAGASVTFTATVSGSAPTGSVNFKDGANSISGCTAVGLAGSGNIRTATCATASLASGSHSMSAVYGGDASNNGSTSSTLTQTVNKATSGTALSSSANPSGLGASVTFTASVTGFSPTGSINFTDGGVSISGCSAVALAGSGNTRTAQCSTSALGAATHSIVASYGGDSSNAASVSATLSQVVSSVSPPSSLVNPSFESPFQSGGYQYNPTGAGVGWTFSSTSGIQGNGSAWNAVAAPDGVQTAFVQMTGTISQTLSLNAGSYTLSFRAAQRTCCGVQPVKVTVDGTQIGSLVSPASGSFAAFSIPFSVSGSGSHTIVFAGTDPNDRTTFIDAVTLGTGSSASTTTTLASALNPSIVGASVTFTATVTGSAPTGTVNFKDGASSISGCAAVALAGSGNTRTAQCSTSALSAATHSIVANYGGNTGNAPSISTTLSQVVNGSVTSVNVALASAGAVASASSTFSSAYPAAAINNGDRAGVNFGAGGVWKDDTPSVFPDWVEIDFSGAKTIDHVIVYSAQDNNLSPVDPSDTLTFTLRGLTAFDVQAWNGTSWIKLGSVTGNNLVKRTVSFGATTTSKLRIIINGAVGGKSGNSFLTEVEAWTPGVTPPVSAVLASSINPAKVSQPVILTATVAGSNPTGTVGFTRGGSPIAGCAAVALTGSGNQKSALCTTSFAAAGSYPIVAGYGGDANNAATSSAPFSEVVKVTK